MQIQSDPRKRFNRQQIEKAKKKVSGRTQSTTNNSHAHVQASNFAESLESSTESQIHQTLNGLMEGVDKTGNDLLRDPSERNLITYVTSVRAFMRKAMDSAYCVEKMFDRHNRLYTVVREVDKKIIDLTDEVIATQGKPIELAARVQEIRGVLLDMYI